MQCPVVCRVLTLRAGAHTMIILGTLFKLSRAAPTPGPLTFAIYECAALLMWMVSFPPLMARVFGSGNTCDNFTSILTAADFYTPFIFTGCIFVRCRSDSTTKCMLIDYLDTPRLEEVRQYQSRVHTCWHCPCRNRLVIFTLLSDYHIN